jgi:CRP/FNR family transcriptional regulator
MLKKLEPAALVALLEQVNTNWSELFSSLAWFLGLSFRDRLLWIFQDLANRYGVRESRGILLTPELSHDDLAQMIASSRAMVSRLIAEFVDQGELARQGRHYILVNYTSGSTPPGAGTGGTDRGPSAQTERPIIDRAGWLLGAFSGGP